MYQNEAARAFHCYFLTFRRYAQFSGRATRSEFWYRIMIGAFLASIWKITLMLCILADASMDKAPHWFSTYSGGEHIIEIIYALAIFPPLLAVTWRRLHDTNRSGCWYFLYFTIIGIIPLVIFLCEKSDPEANRFGEVPDPIMGDLGKTSALNGNHLEMIEKLAELRDRGILTEEEFIREKSLLLPGTR